MRAGQTEPAANGAVGGAGAAAGGLGVSRRRPPGPALIPRIPVRTGMDRLAADGWGELAGQAGRRRLQPDRRRPRVPAPGRPDARPAGCTSSRAFGPEHGFRGSAQAGGSEGTGIDARTGIPVYDAYGASPGQVGRACHRGRASTPSSSTSRTSAPASTPTSGRMYTSMVAAARLGAALRRARPAQPDRRAGLRADDDPGVHLRRGPQGDHPAARA